jgi:putative hydrolase of the HAD superfamily
MNPFDWIVFDSTGTLMTPSPEPAAVYHSIARSHGCRLALDQVRSNLKNAMKEHFFSSAAVSSTDETIERGRWRQIVAAALAVGTAEGLDTASFSAVFDRLWQHFAEPAAWTVFEEVPGTLDRLRSRGYRLAVASNFDERLRRILHGKTFGGRALADRFDEVFISSEVGWSKPQPEFYDAVFRRLQVDDPSRVLMIGDTPEADVHAAEAAGWAARLLVRGRSETLTTLLNDL